MPPSASWEAIHDLVRDGEFYGDDRAVKRQWLSDKLGHLERMGLVRRTPTAGKRSELVVLRDDGGGGIFDSPTGRSDDGSSYVTVLTPLIIKHRLAHWGAPQLTAFLAAMIAERYTRSDPQ